MKTILFSISRLLVILFASLNGLAYAESLEKVWETEAVFAAPESVVFDQQRNRFYVSNIQGETNAADGQGFVSIVSSDGRVDALEWVSGLNAPKGMALVGDHLYVADIDTLLVIDVAMGQIVQRFVAEQAKFLNDVAADNTGRVYVSDMLTNAIYRLQGDAFEIWHQDAALASPNGVYVDGTQLVVASWGNMTDGFKTEVPGHLLLISLADASLKPFADGAPIGNLDGVESDGQGGYYLTDWMKGTLMHVDSSGRHRDILQLEQGAADLTVLPEQKLLLIPRMLNNTLVAYRLP